MKLIQYTALNTAIRSSLLYCLFPVYLEVQKLMQATMIDSIPKNNRLKFYILNALFYFELIFDVIV